MIAHLLQGHVSETTQSDMERAEEIINSTYQDEDVMVKLMYFQSVIFALMLDKINRYTGEIAEVSARDQVD